MGKLLSWIWYLFLERENCKVNIKKDREFRYNLRLSVKELSLVQYYN